MVVIDNKDFLCRWKSADGTHAALLFKHAVVVFWSNAVFKPEVVPPRRLGVVVPILLLPGMPSVPGGCAITLSPLALPFRLIGFILRGS